MGCFDHLDGFGIRKLSCRIRRLLIIHRSSPREGGLFFSELLPGERWLLSAE
ncbi:MAG: hypothetical protein U5K99_06570 [Anaerolineales bacterium]|nr:hypothetical protein [Anaerolineales bacterium]